MAMIEAAAIDITMPSPPITASQSQGASIRSRPSTNTWLRHFRQRVHGARQRPQRGAQDIVAIDPRRRGKGDRKRRGRANLLEQFLAALRRQPLRIVDAFGDSLGIEHHGGGHHRAGQRTAPGLVAAGDRPDAALDQRALAPKARRRHRDHALRQFCLFGDLVVVSWRIYPESCRDGGQARASAQPGTGFNSRYSVATGSCPNPANAPAGPRRPRCRGRPRLPRDGCRDRRNIRIAAVGGLMRGLEQRGALGDREVEHGVDFLA